MKFATGDIDSEERGSAARANGGKVSFSILPLHLLAGAARVLMAGRVKYAHWNWAKGMLWSVSFDCMMRHAFKWWYLGEDFDPETGEHHLDYVICNALFARHFVDSYPEGDDRPPSFAQFSNSMPNFAKLFDEEDFRERNNYPRD